MGNMQEGLTNSLFLSMKKVVLITGASRGIGKATAIKLAEKGYDLILNYCHSKDEAIQLKEDLEKTYQIKCLAIQADVSKEDEVDKMFIEAEDTFGGVDILINNAGIDMPSFFKQKNADEFKRVLDVNVIGAFNCAKRAYEHMQAQQFGKIINLSSTNGINTYYPVNIDYDASKAALISLTHNLAIQFAPHVTVNAIAPGFIGTEHELEGYDADFLQEETNKILLGRYGKPEEVASLIAFLISEDASFINNSVIRIDGGQIGSN